MSAALSQLENERLRLDGGVRHIWREVVAGRMDEAERDSRLADIEAQRHALRGKTCGDLAVAVPVPHQRSGARAVDRSRQRRLAAAGPMPREIDGVPIPTALGAVAYTYPFNFSGHPAASVRAGFTDLGLPAGLQIIAPRHRDDLVLQAAYAYEQAAPWNDQWPRL